MDKTNTEKSNNVISLASCYEVNINNYYNNTTFGVSEWEMVKIYRSCLPGDFGWFVASCAVAGLLTSPLLLLAASTTSWLCGVGYVAATLAVGTVMDDRDFCSNLRGCIKYQTRFSEEIAKYEGKKYIKKKLLKFGKVGEKDSGMSAEK